MKKKSVKRYILWGVLALVVVWLALMPLMARQQQIEDGPRASILSANVSTGSIRCAIHGGGTLEAGENENITLPKDVKITEFLVKNGDVVREGDALAAVDKVSVMTAITEVRDSMDAVRKQMVSVSDEKAATEVSATAGGRVKLVYAKVGDRVESVMLEHGALAVLSLDSKMCVRLTADVPFAAGEALTVTLADGKAVTGRVESNVSGEMVVVIEDKGYEVGQTVMVENVGIGILEIHSPWKATAFAGTVSIAYAQPEQTLGSGAALFALKDTDYTAQREKLAQTHRDYEELLQKLFKMYDTGVITAPCGGLVSGIDKNSAHLLAAEEEEMVARPLNTGEGEFRLVLLSEFTQLGLNEAGCTGNMDCPLDIGSENHAPSCVKACTKNDDCHAEVHVTDCPHNCTNSTGCKAKFHKDTCQEKCTGNNSCQVTKPENHLDYCPKRCTNAKGCQAAYHKDTCPEKCTNGTDCQAGIDNHLMSCPKRCIYSESCKATEHRDGCPAIVKKTYNGVVGVVTRVEATGNVLYLALNNSGGEVIYTNKWDFGALDLNNTSGVVPSSTPYSVGNSADYSQGDVVVVILDENGEPRVIPTGKKASVSGGNPGMDLSGLMGRMPSFSMSGFGGMGGYGSASSSQNQLYDLEGDVLMTVTPQESMTLTVPVDESDISSVKPGMAAEVTVIALPEAVIEGEITKVAKSGSGNGGSSKFAVEITLPRQGEMLAGMSASAVISLYEKMNVLTLPAEALTEDGAKTVVYTALDKKTGEPVNPVEVTTGLSDGERVEILSGLASGDTVYYAYYDTLEESDAVELDRLKVR